MAMRLQLDGLLMFATVVTLPQWDSPVKTTARAVWRVRIKEEEKSQRVSKRHKPLAHANVFVQQSNKSRIQRRTPQRKTLLSQQHCFRSAKEHLGV